MRKISAIVPAAGLSRRMGGPNKLLLPWHGGTVVSEVVRTLRECGLDVVVVTGRDSQAVAEAVRPARSVFNPGFEEGLGTSIAAGVSAAAECDGYLIALGDMPRLQRETIQALVSRFEGQSLESILAPVYEEEPERPGHPVLFGSAYRSELASLRGDTGARSILDEHRANLLLIPVSGGLPDIDWPADLQTEH